MRILKQPLILDLDDDQNYTSLAGRFLIASPFCSFNEMFNKSLIYIASHGKHGAVGLIVNHLINKMSSKHLLKMLKEDEGSGDLIIPVCLGGPIEPERGFIIHTKDYGRNVLFTLNDKLNISSNVDIIKDIVSGYGPEKSLFVMGYTGWESNQLEKEMENNLWIVADIDDELIFSQNHETKWQEALKHMGMNNSVFCSQTASA